MSKNTTTAISASLENFDELPDSAHVRLPIVCALYGFGPATAWRYVKAGRIPAPKKIGPRVVAWSVRELRASLLAIAA